MAQQINAENNATTSSAVRNEIQEVMNSLARDEGWLEPEAPKKRKAEEPPTMPKPGPSNPGPSKPEPLKTLQVKKRRKTLSHIVKSNTEESGEKRYNCHSCGIGFISLRKLNDHRRSGQHYARMYMSAPDRTFESKTENQRIYRVIKEKGAFNNAIKTFFITCKTKSREITENTDPVTIEEFFDDIREEWKAILDKRLVLSYFIRVYCKLQCRMYNERLDEEVDKSFGTTSYKLHSVNQIDHCVSKLENMMKRKFEFMEIENSGWSLKHVIGLEIDTYTIETLKLKGGDCNADTCIPKWIQKSSSTICIKNTDDRCFWYCIYCKFIPADKRRNDPNINYPNIVEKLQREKNITFNWKNIRYPVSIKLVNTFERINPFVSINVYGLDGKFVYPIRVCDDEKEIHYDLLLIDAGNKKCHYVYISHFDRLIKNQLTLNHQKITVCRRCFVHYYGVNRIDRLKEHKKLCNSLSIMKDPAKVEFPKENCVIEFTQARNSFPVHYIAVADFEVLFIEPKDNIRSSIDFEVEHEVIAYTYYIVDILNNSYKDPISYVGLNAAENFMCNITQEALDIQERYKLFPTPPTLSTEEREIFESSTKCCICDKIFDLSKPGAPVKVIHHCHATGKFLGAAHATPCNINASTRFLPVYFHNMSKYDGKFLSLTLDYQQSKIIVIPRTEEEYISIKKQVDDRTKFYLKFIDSYRLLPASLRSLVEYIPKENLFHTCKHYNVGEKFEIACQKNFFPYEYLNKITKLNDTTLPSKRAFYSKLTAQSIRDEDYQFAKNAWRVLGCENLGDYLREYNKIDVLLLTDVVVEFRKFFLNTYKLDPAHYVSLPSLSYDAFLKMTGARLDNITDCDMWNFFEKSIRGGICNTVIRYVKQNSMLVNPKSFDQSLDPCSILYIDANNLYGLAMSMKVPYANFRWDNNVQLYTPAYIMENFTADGDVGCFLEVDLEIPTNLHDKFNSFPPCPEKKCPPASNYEKLLCTLEPKENYIIHVRMLQFCLRHGIILKKVHRVVTFNQSDVMKPYIDLNTNLRAKFTKNKFFQQMLKLLNNALYGKTMENVKERMRFELITDKNTLIKKMSNPFFKCATVFKETLVGVHMYKQKITLDKPIFIGAAVLELSKLHMFEMYYDHLPKIFVDQIDEIERPVPFELAYIDTDSFILKIQAHDVTPYLDRNRQYFDLSNYPENHRLYDTTNCRTLGKFKNEVPVGNVNCYISLCPKVYAIDLGDDNSITKHKGISLNRVKDEFPVKRYYDALVKASRVGEKNCVEKIRQPNFRSRKLKLYTVWQSKVVLAVKDDKRKFDLQNFRKPSLAYGYEGNLQIMNPSNSTYPLSK